jgi:20S proteasome alpha/beta subunit
VGRGEGWGGHSEIDMTQVIACSTHEGIVLATDSRATWFDETGETRHFSLKKLLRLNSHTAMLSAGAGIGVEMSLAFQNFLQRQGTEAIEDIVSMALFFFTDQYGKWLGQREIEHAFSPPTPDGACEEVSPLNDVYLILAGYSFRDRVYPYHLHLFSSEGERVSIKAIPTSQIIVVPRSLSMERRLEAQHQGGSSLDQLLTLCKSFLNKRSAEGEEVGPPFYFATITPSGYKEVVEEEVKG